MEHTDIGARNVPNPPGGVGTGEQARQVAGTATEGAKDVVQTAMDQAAEVGTEIKEQGRDVVNQARSQLRGHADDVVKCRSMP